MTIEHKALTIGRSYSKALLAELFDEPRLAKVREGWFQSDDEEFIPFFVTLNKENADLSVAYNDYFEDGLFFWESQSRNTLQSKWIKKFRSSEVTPILFVREIAKIRNKTQDYVYAGRLVDPLVDEASSRPVRFTFFPADLQGNLPEKLKPLLAWRPGSGRREDLGADFAAVVERKRRKTTTAGETPSEAKPREIGYQPGPTPGPKDYSVSTDEHDEWYVYVLALSDTNTVKIGFSHDPKARLKEYNHGILPEITGLSWSLAFTHKVVSAETAKQIEQQVLSKHAKSQLRSNGEVLRDMDATDLQLEIIGFARAAQGQ